MPQEQAAHFCQLFVCEGEADIYPLRIYAQHLTQILCDSATYQGLSAEQVFTGLLFFPDDWKQDSLVKHLDPQRLQLIGELRSGATLRIFPHVADDGTVSWYAPTDDIPESVGSEHRRYMQEVFPRLNVEVQTGHWETVDANISRMITYQCQFGAAPPKGNNQLMIMGTVLLIIFLIMALLHFVKKSLHRH